MKKSELKKILKPLIKECIKEAIFEEGVLSGIITEVVRATAQPSVVVEAVREEPSVLGEQKRGEQKQRLVETKKKMLDAIGNDAFNGIDLFEGTEPMRGGGGQGTPQPSSALSNYAPGDAGIDISSIVSSKWKDLV